VSAGDQLADESVTQERRSDVDSAIQAVVVQCL
jgi:hypothetical protein